MIKTLILQTTFGQIFFSKETFFGQEAGESDISLTAGLISAIYSMTEETQEQKIEEIELEELRSVFRELPGEKLFIITVDKRMDTRDAADLLQDIIDGFAETYGEDFTPDGQILNDFEEPVTKIVDDKLWYNSTPKSLGIMDYLVLLTLLFSFAWYPYFLLNGKEQIVDKLLHAYESGVVDLLLTSILTLLKTFLPITVNLLMLKHWPNMTLPFRYMKEFVTRPTRGGYAELLPAWFLTLPLIIAFLGFSVIYNGRGVIHGLTAEVFHDNLVYRRPIVNDVGEYQGELFYYYISIYIVLFILVWYIVPPLIIGLITENFNWNFLKSGVIVSSISLVTLMPGFILTGDIVQNLMNFDTSSVAAYADAAKTLRFFVTVTLPINVFIAINIFFNGVGLGPIIKKNRSRFTIGYLASAFLVLQLVDFLWDVIFFSGILGESF